MGTHIDELPRLEREQKIQGFKDVLERYRIGRMTSRGYPIIKDICFVGCPLRGRPLDIDVLNDAIYNTAMEMESPNGKCLNVERPLQGQGCHFEIHVHVHTF